MKLTRLSRRLAVAAAALVAAAAPGIAETFGIRVGERFPEIVLPALEDGTPLSIASFRGRKVALHVWASW